MESMRSNEHQEARSGPSGSRAKWVFIAFAAIAAFFLFTEHQAHLFGILPFLLLLACPLMHFFHHRGHGKGRGGHGGGSGNKPEGGAQ